MAALSALLGHLAALPFTLLGVLLDALDAIADDDNARADAALVLVAVLALVGWACGVFSD